MFSFLGFGKRKKEQRDERQREVIRVALNNVLRRRGISPQSIGCEMVSMTRKGGADVILVQLLILNWNDGLMHDAPDIEEELFEVICLFGRGTQASDLMFVWKFALEKGIASEKVPDAATPAPVSDMKDAPPALALAPKITVVPKVEPPVKFDLPRSALDDIDNQNDDGFPATVIGRR